MEGARESKITLAGAFFGLICLLTSCQEAGKTANCPSPAAPPRKIAIAHEGDFYQSWQSRNIIPREDTLTFQSARYDFVFCRGSGSWSVQPGTLKAGGEESQGGEEAMAKLANPPFATIDWQGKTYQYRVLLVPNPFPNLQVEPQQVIFELAVPGRAKPQSKVLYTLPQVKQEKAGISLGLPQVTAAVPHQGQLFWAIAAQQGEGNGGIATIVSYKPETAEISLLQPQELAAQQIRHLAITGRDRDLTFWLALQRSGEGNPYLPTLGLGAYRPASGSFRAYHVRNSPLVGAIPQKLLPEAEFLWVGTGNGICRLKWQEANNPQSWTCWRFALMAKLPPGGVPLYPSLFSQEVGGKLTPSGSETVEVLWWSPRNGQPPQGRYEVSYDRGFTFKSDSQGATPWSEVYPAPYTPKPWEPPFNWLGSDWHWQGVRFVRPFDAVSLNEFGGGPLGIGPGKLRGGIHYETNAMRGDLDLLELTKTSTQVKHYSGWVPDSLLAPYPTILPHQPPATAKPNPLEALVRQVAP